MTDEGKQSELPPEDEAPTKGDILALGIGCLVFVIMFVAVVLVGIAREG